MGYLRPLVQRASADDEARLRRPVFALTAGFTVSALLVYGAAFWLGRLLPASKPAVEVVGGFLILAWVAADVGLGRLRVPTCRRQTRRSHFFRYGPTRGALLWGLDTGLAVTTIRVGALTWAAFTVALLGLVPAWIGLAYAAGFTLPIIVLVLLVPARDSREGPPEPSWLMERLAMKGRLVRRIGAAAMLAASLACFAAASL